jgi:hypothetical protein
MGTNQYNTIQRRMVIMFLNQKVLESLLEGYQPRKCSGLTESDKAVLNNY